MADFSKDDIAAILDSDLFDAEWYQKTYPDVNMLGIDPLEHYLWIGAKLARKPSAHFDSTSYLRLNPDVASAGVHPLVHYVKWGRAERRQTSEMVDGNTENRPLLRPIDGIKNFLPVGLGEVSNLSVDIIIPVYRNLEETIRCLESVINDRQRPRGEIIVVDDCSPDPQLSERLLDYHSQGFVRLLRNNKNVGFVSSVNRGIEAAAPNDVVLLNSDTEVPQGWLRRLAAHAYSEERIGSVTPFSNNATICSYPSSEGGPLPSGRSLVELDSAFQMANSGRSIRIPTAVGFAMYIRRACLDDVGTFDAETFGLGYGEENDFCMRAVSRGWKHLLACDTFVYHTGEVSFGKNSTWKDRAWRKLIARHPEYPARVSDFIQKNPACPSRFSATAALFRSSGRPVILLISHDLGGGTERHIRDLIRICDNDAEFLWLKPAGEEIELSVPAMVGHPTLRLPAGSFDSLVTILRGFGVQRVHIHHVLNIPIDLRKLVNILGVPFDFTVHDYYTICPHINLIPPHRKRYCGEPNEEGCNYCIYNSKKGAVADIISWRMRHSWLLTEASRVICPSHDVILRMSRHGHKRNTLVAPHESDISQHFQPRIHEIDKNGPLRIAILGVLASHKGREIVESVSSLAPSGEFEFTLVGTSTPPIHTSSPGGYRETGSFTDDRLQEIINDIRPHLIWFPAVGPETYSYTLSAAIRAGVPVVAADIGAFPERLASREWVWLVPASEEPRLWLEAFRNARTSISARVAPRTASPQHSGQDFYREKYTGNTLDRSASAKLNYVRRVGQQGKLSVLLVPEVLASKKLSPCAYIRLLLPLRRLSEKGLIDLAVASADDAHFYKADVLITNRYVTSDMQEVEKLLCHAQRQGMRIFYDIDDDLLNISDDHPEVALLRGKAAIVKRLVAAADVLFVSTERLREVLLPFKSPIFVVENGIDERLLPYPVPSQRDKLCTLRILYMGTMTHERDLQLVEPALSKIIADFKDRVRFDIIGVTARPDLPKGFSRYFVPSSVQCSYPAFMSWLARQGQWDIGIAPLVATAFNDAKSLIKALDYMALGVATVASDAAAYKKIPDNAVLRVPDQSEAWYEVLSELLRDPEMRSAASMAGQKLLHDKYTLSAQHGVRVSAWESALLTAGLA